MGAHPTPTAAYWAFFEHFNAKDPAGWAGAMSYPHIRVSAAPPRRQDAQPGPRTASGLYPTPEDYASMAANAGWGRFEATGWVRTQGLTPRVVHSSADKVHLAGGWTRYRDDDSAILTNRVLYVMTRMDEGWGIQARFGVDSFKADASGEAAVAAAERLGELRNAGDFEAFAQCLLYPLIIVGVGEVHRIESAEQFLAVSAAQPIEAVPGSVSVVNTGTSGVNVAARRRANGVERDEILLMVQHGDEWQLAAVSAV